MLNEFNEKQKEMEISKMNKKAEDVVTTAVAAAAAIGGVPIPFADAPLLISAQVAMMAKISDVYKIDIGKDGLKMLAVAALGAGGGGFIGRVIANNLLKCIPFGGPLIGGLISGATAAAITLSMGNSFIAVCKKVKLGELIYSDIISTKGVSYMTGEFEKQMKKNKK
ncbi:hypothetical protein HMPREF9628_00622 [Peptoanaerobacter stomatis]|uniref:DUF697 domain-containing protein n=1 Tax=Peptoanaerobacter stomatis TaxID=796937 RepID=G9XFG5_9FIRM|nr:DUF697 domain-containing protein [Peptoanaerobacter stomatis]EHL16690.1 hypothetical protein HMPREF9628_00622 [Peptoanaerobacter stomatis]